MKNDETIQSNAIEKSLRRRHIIAAVWLSVWILVFFFYTAPKWESRQEPSSGDIICQALAKQLDKDVSELTSKDFARITTFTLEDKPLSSIKLLSKFTNLQELKLRYIRFPEKDIPKWVKFLEKIHVLNESKKTFIDLSPLKNLSNLRTLHLDYVPISDITPLKELVNLEELSIDYTNVSDIQPLEGLRNLKELYIGNCKSITDQQKNDLQKALPELEIYE